MRGKNKGEEVLCFVWDIGSWMMPLRGRGDSSNDSVSLPMVATHLNLRFPTLRLP